MDANQTQSMISSFLEIAVGQTINTATQYLKATNWKLEEAIQLFYSGYGTIRSNEGDEVQSPLPLHEQSPAFPNLDEETNLEEGGAASASMSRVNLDPLNRPPFHMMFHGSFQKAKSVGHDKNKWLLVNLQSATEIDSQMLNRDTWGNKTVSETISNYFIFLQVNNDSRDGKKVCVYYKLDSAPVVMVIDPITGQKMRSWSGMVQPETLLEDLIQFMDSGPRDHHPVLSNKHRNQIQVTVDESNEYVEPTAPLKIEEDDDDDDDGVEETGYPPLLEEPKVVDMKLVCRVGVRLPDGSRVKRSFLLTDSIKLLWSFCASQIEDSKKKSFHLMETNPGASKCLDFDSGLTFEESGLANSMITVNWD